MKTVKLSELEKRVLLAQKEALSVEHNGQLVGYYYPVVDHQEVKRAKEELDLIMEKVLSETGLTEEEYVEAFLKAGEKSCV